MKVAIVILAVVAVVAADSYGYNKGYKPATYSAPAYKPTTYAAPAYKPATYSAPAYTQEYSAPAHYKFDWAVNDDYTYVNMGQYEARDGDHTKGNYWVVLPDGRKQNVDYKVDGYSGYVADVTYDGYAKAYDHKTYSAPAYSASAYSAPAYKARY